MLPFYELRKEDIIIAKRANMTFGPHLHEYMEIIICTEGSTKVECSGEKNVLNPNDLMIVFPNQVHSYSTQCPGKYWVIIFSTRFVPKFTNHFSKIPKTPCLPAFKAIEEVVLCCDRIYTEANGTNNIDVIEGYLYVILSRIFEHVKLMPIKANSNNGIFVDAITYIIKNFKKDINLKKISKELSVNSNYLSSLFSKKLGLSFHEYLNRHRIDYSKYLLRYSDKKIGEIAFECGFNTWRSFNRNFLKQAGCSPSDYKNADNLSTQS